MKDSPAEILGKVLLGGTAGFALFFIATGLGLGGRARGEGREAPHPKDDKRLSFVMTEPTTTGGSMSFRSRDGEIYSLRRLVDRVKSGGRSDVELRVSGAVIQGAWNEAQRLLEQSGLTVWLAKPGALVGGQYEWRSR